jgi:hypothetical protein
MHLFVLFLNGWGCRLCGAGVKQFPTFIAFFRCRFAFFFVR